LARSDGGGEIGDRFEEAGDGSKTIIVATEGLNPTGGLGAGEDGAGKDAEVAKDVREAGLRETMNAGGDGFAAAKFGGDDEFALAFGFRGEEAGAGDVGIEKTKLGEKCFRGGELGRVIDPVRVGAGDEVETAAAGVEVDDDVGEGEEDRGKKVGEDFAGSALGVAGEAAVEVAAVKRGEARGGVGGGGIEGGDEDEAAGDIGGRELAPEVLNGDLTGVFVAVVAGEEEDGGAGAVCDDTEGDEEVGPTAEVVGIGDGEVARVFADGGVEGDRAVDGALHESLILRK